MRSFVLVLFNLAIIYSVFVQAQTPVLTWSQSRQDADVNTQPLVIYKLNGVDHLFTLNFKTGAGTSTVLNDDGTPGELVWESSTWVPGTDCAASYEANGMQYLIVGNSKKGKFIIYRLEPGKGPILHSSFNEFEKGYNEMIVYEEGSNNYMLMVNPSKRVMMVKKLDPKGGTPATTEKIDTDYGLQSGAAYWAGRMLYLVLPNSQNKYLYFLQMMSKGYFKKLLTSDIPPGIKEAAILQRDGQFYAALSAPDAGKTWLHKLNGNGSLGEVVWTVSDWGNGVYHMLPYEAAGSNYMVTGNTNTGEISIYRFFGEGPGTPDDSKDDGGKVVVVNDRKKDKTKKDAEEDHQKTNSKNKIETIKEAKKNSTDMVTTIFNFNQKIYKAKRSIEAVENLSGMLGSMIDKAGNVSDVLDTFEKVPKLGKLTSALSRMITNASKIIETVKRTIDFTALPITNFVKGKIEESLKSSSELMKKVDRMNYVYSNMLRDESGTLAALEDPNKAALINDGINNSLTEFNVIYDEIKRIEPMMDFVLEVNEPVNNFNNDVKKVDDAIGKADNIAGNIDDVLSKKFEKRVLGKLISVSLKDVLTGGGLASKVKKFTGKWANKLINPLIDKLVMKIPSVPGVKQVVDIMNTIKDKFKKEAEKDKMTELSQKFDERSRKLALEFGIKM